MTNAHVKKHHEPLFHIAKRDDMPGWKAWGIRLAAIVIGFLYTIIVYKGGSLWPCIASHMFVNASSVFAGDRGPFHSLLAAVFGQASPELAQLCSAGGIILLSGGYAWWLWKRA